MRALGRRPRSFVLKFAGRHFYETVEPELK